MEHKLYKSVIKRSCDICISKKYVNILKIE